MHSEPLACEGFIHSQKTREMRMKSEPPRAFDLRFGMEGTLYVTNC